MTERISSLSRIIQADKHETSSRIQRYGVKETPHADAMHMFFFSLKTKGQIKC